MMQAGVVGLMRVISNRKRNRKHRRHGNPRLSDWDRHIEGAMAEFAVALYFKRHWDGSLGDIDAGDVGLIEVRSTVNENYNLIIHDDDKDNVPYVLVVGSLGEYRLVGWVYGSEGKEIGEWKEHEDGRPAFYVMQSQLWPMSKFDHSYWCQPDLFEKEER
jgi:hypothetical protein